MQHTKNNHKIGEFQTFIESNEKTGECLNEILKFFEIRRIFKQFEGVKQRGIEVTLILTALLIMLFYKSANIYNFFYKGLAQRLGIDGSKNPYYDLLSNSYLCWRSLLFLVAKRFRYLYKRKNQKEAGIHAMIFDDSPIEKTSYKTEMVSRIHDHVSGRFILGYKLLVCGYWNGSHFIPIDFSLHRERGSDLDKARKKRNTAKKKVKKSQQAHQEEKAVLADYKQELKELKALAQEETSKTLEKTIERKEKQILKRQKKTRKLHKDFIIREKELEKAVELVKTQEKRTPLYGLSNWQKRQQYRNADRRADSPGYERVKEADMKKGEVVKKMFSRAIKKGFIPDYVLFDSWFMSLELLDYIKSFYRKAIQVVGMIRMGNTRYDDPVSNQSLTASELKRKYRSQMKRSRKFQAQYIKVPVMYGRHQVHLFFIRLGKHDRWKAILTTDLNMNFSSLMEVYQIRWSIEVFFKEAKQYLNMGKCKCSNFDAQIGSITISMLQYIMLTWYKELHYGKSLGSLFDNLTQQSSDETILKYMFKLFWDIVEKIGTILNVDCLELFEEIIREDEKAKQILKLISPEITEKIAA